jgi:hypothetical protein
VIYRISVREDNDAILNLRLQKWAISTTRRSLNRQLYFPDILLLHSSSHGYLRYVSLPYCLVALLSRCPTVLLPYCLVTLLSCYPTVLLPYCLVTLLSCYPTVSLLLD